MGDRRFQLFFMRLIRQIWCYKLTDLGHQDGPIRLRCDRTDESREKPPRNYYTTEDHGPAISHVISQDHVSEQKQQWLPEHDQEPYRGSDGC